MNKKIKEQLKSDYEELEIKPSADLWSKIEVGLNDEDVANAGKITFHWWKYAAVALFLISFGAIFYFDKNNDDKKEFTKAVIRDKVEKLNIDKKESRLENENLVRTEIHNVDSQVNSIKKDERVKQSISTNTKYIYEDVVIDEKLKENENIQIPVAEEIDNSLNQKPELAERKKVNYTNAEQLLLGRELDKTREENLNEQRKFGVLDIRKIKSPNSLKILGFTVYSDEDATK
ncbi:hypothetical protein CHRY9390_02802 [Chryseobacterium aquaeductus]|uniref:Anti-sigma factor n=1 Tax=Chryseobacterium aquaeductus TaxID=2675056 RepID=A0A9N8QRI7_9FLAO|nr:hypothetical protein [Chryseobacterium aquaeductus]CAA7332081.1 hypothetical protein CHRY9390_02802 [Chryseobacterium potabilaquae]CAD7814421.1 hypothetical protein CHRY9390_02802 [Chryseobacterium aquaeductus]